MASTRIPVCPTVTQFVERGYVLPAKRFREVPGGHAGSPVMDDDLMNSDGPSDDELKDIEAEATA